MAALDTAPPTPTSRAFPTRAAWRFAAVVAASPQFFSPEVSKKLYRMSELLTFEAGCAFERLKLTPTTAARHALDVACARAYGETPEALGVPSTLEAAPPLSSAP